VRGQPSIEVQMSTKVQPSIMEIDMSVLGFAKAKRHATIMDRAILLNKHICIPNHDQFMWRQIRQNYDKHVEKMENWKDISEEEKWVLRQGLSLCL